MTTPEEQHTAAATVDTNVSQDVAMTDSALDENETPDGDSQEKTEREEQAEPKAKQSEGQGDNDAEDTKDNEEADTEAMPKSRKAKNTVESPAPSEGRARRERRQTQHYTYTAESKTKKAIVVPEARRGYFTSKTLSPHRCSLKFYLFREKELLSRRYSVVRFQEPYLLVAHHR